MKLKALQESADKNVYLYDHPRFEILERFGAPKVKGDMSIRITVPEFTSLCPLTGQPDFATIVIDYTPGEWCVESKALKMYMMGYRNHGAFHESCVALMAEHLIDLLNPMELVIEGQFTPRGGIPFWPKVTYRR
jgi:7-cyano-7-deazaguanine reductase